MSKIARLCFPFLLMYVRTNVRKDSTRFLSSCRKVRSTPANKLRAPPCFILGNYISQFVLHSIVAIIYVK